ncbi:MAG: hypothetical protein R3C49_00320 [Planctomycetaceae bacterium]
MENGRQTLPDFPTPYPEPNHVSQNFSAISGIVSDTETRRASPARRRKHTSTSRLAAGGAEVLEVKSYPAATLMASLGTDGQLRIEGTDRADRIVVREQNGRISIDQLNIQTAQGSITQVPAASVTATSIAG